jgi:hypothetical protein
VLFFGKSRAFARQAVADFLQNPNTAFKLNGVVWGLWVDFSACNVRVFEMGSRSMCVRGCVTLAVLAIVSIAAQAATAQFTGPITPPQLPSPVQPSVTSNPAGNSGRTIQQIMMLRYLQQRSGGGVKRGVPQFIPFGNQGGFVPQALQQDAPPAVDTNKKSNEDKKAEYQAAREAKKKAAQERAEKRKAARAKGGATSAPKTPA